MQQWSHLIKNVGSAKDFEQTEILNPQRDSKGNSPWKPHGNPKVNMRVTYLNTQKEKFGILVPDLAA